MALELRVGLSQSFQDLVLPSTGKGGGTVQSITGQRREDS